MGSLKEKIDEDIKKAILLKEKEKLESLRAIKAALLLANSSGQPVTEEEEIKILRKLVKQRKDAAEIYKQQNRNDLAEKELYEASIIEKYLPEQLNEEELTKIISEIIHEIGAKDLSAMGKIMPIAINRIGNKADGKTISQIVKKLLS